MQPSQFYAGLELDRAAHLRCDAAWLAERLHDGATRLLPVWRSQHLVRMRDGCEPLVLSPIEGKTLIAAREELVFLGERGGAAHFAIDVSGLQASAVRPAEDAELADLRAIGPLLRPGDAATLAYARAMLHWHARHRFCGACGATTRSEHAGHVRRCTASGCGIEHFPRTDPAVIMLVTDGDRCLLGRQARWPQGMVSTLAGFVEPGESLEEAVAREVLEEAGVRLSDVRYVASQPWPFPGSIMLGFFAAAASREIRCDAEELEHAAWYSRDEVASFGEADFSQPMRPGAALRLPPRDSIARFLIDRWLGVR
jgi:NAD+ diphosphatase